MNKISQDWADQLAKTDKAEHRPNNDYGENIFIIMSNEKVSQLGNRAVDNWYSEIQYFDFQKTEEVMSDSTKACNV